jgi:hypothetical protein
VTDDAPQNEAAIGHLIVLRTTIQAAITNIDAAIALLAGSAPPTAAEEQGDDDPRTGCPNGHPEDQQQIISPVGQPIRARCGVCQAEYAKEATW